MISIFVLYSQDRIEEFLKTLLCLQEMQGYGDCQKILCVDGTESNIDPYEFEVEYVERPDSGFFCWAKCWDQCVARARFDQILYLDCDRVLPRSYLIQVDELLRDRTFLYPARLYALKEQVDAGVLRQIRDAPQEYDHLLRLDKRLSDPYNCIAKKNPMSGCVAFTKRTFEESGGLDYDFQGWGYPDTDYFMKTYEMGFEFQTVDSSELHQKHSYIGGVRMLRLHNLWNGLKFADKWGLGMPDYFREEARALGVFLRHVRKFDDMKSFLEFSEKRIKV